MNNIKFGLDKWKEESEFKAVYMKEDPVLANDLHSSSILHFVSILNFNAQFPTGFWGFGVLGLWLW